MTTLNAGVVKAWLDRKGAKNHDNNFTTNGTVLYSYGLLIGEWVHDVPLVYNYTSSDKIGPYGHAVLSAGFYSITTSAHVNKAVSGGGLLMPTKGF